MSAAFQSWLAATRREVAELLPDVDPCDVLTALASLALRRLIESVESGSQAMLAALIVGELASIAAEPKASQRRMLVGLLVELLDRRTGESRPVSVAEACAKRLGVLDYTGPAILVGPDGKRGGVVDVVRSVSGIVYHRQRHAGHAQGGAQIWDTEQWSVPGTWADERPAGVPADAKRERGFMVGPQLFVTWERQVPTEGPLAGCQVCALRGLPPYA